MSRGGMASIAKRMHQEALLQEGSGRRLRGGLCLELSRNGQEWELRVLRQDGRPSVVEVEIVRQHFHVPLFADVEELEQGQVMRWRKK